MSRGELRSNSLGLLAASSLTAAYMGPALSIYALFGPMSAIVGLGVGFVMLFAMILTLLSAISFGMLAKEMPSAGGMYSWSCVALGDSVGLWIGLITVTYYVICLIFPPIIFGQFFNEVLIQAGLPVGIATWMLGAIIMLIAAAVIVYRGIVVSAHLAFVLLLVEIAVIASLAGTFLIIAIKQGSFSLAPMTFSACKNGWSGIFLALPMAIMCMACDAATPASEETRNAKWTIPVAVVLTCIIIGLWYVVGLSAFAMARSTEDAVNAFAGNDVAPMVARAWGPFRILVSLTAMTAALGAFIPGITAASRVMFAMARQRRLPYPLATLHPKFLSPWNALHLAFVITLFGTIPAVLVYGATSTIEWWSFTLGWFIGIVYLAANLVNIVYYWRLARSRFHPVWNMIVPALAMVVQLTVVWQSVIVELWNQGRLGQSVQAFIAGVSTLSLLYVVYVRNRTPFVAN